MYLVLFHLIYCLIKKYLLINYKYLLSLVNYQLQIIYIDSRI